MELGAQHIFSQTGRQAGEQAVGQGRQAGRQAGKQVGGWGDRQEGR